MSSFRGTLRPMKGSLNTRVIRAPGPPLSWRLRQWTRPDFVFGLISVYLAHLFSSITGILTFQPKLTARLIKADGRVVNYGRLSHRLVTTALVEFLIDQLQAESSEIGDFKFHDSGVGVTAANITDVDIETTDGETRATGSQEETSSSVYKSIGTIAYSSTKAITEHGLFSKATGTTLMDRHVFSAINVDDGDSIEFTYELDIDDGG